jgi:hypothetical protein
MLDQWLGPMSVSLFARDYLRAQPYASPSSACRAMPIFGWDALDRLLIRNPPDVLVVARGKLLEVPTPRTLGEALDLVTSGTGLVIRHAEKLDDRVTGLAASVTQHLPGEVHVQLIITPPGTYGFGWHYDDEDDCWPVLIIHFGGLVACGKMHRGFTFYFPRHFSRPVLACQYR